MEENPIRRSPPMVSAWLVLMLHTFFLPLRLERPERSFPRALKPEEERRYLELAAAGDQEAKDQLIVHNLRLVAHIVKKYYNQSGDQDDLISIGTIGLIKGVSTFKPDKGVRLSTYASRCIENEILMHFRSLKKTSGEVSLSDALEGDDEEGALSLMDVIRVDDTMLEDLSNREAGGLVRKQVDQCLDDRERKVILLRYGLSGGEPLTQREVAKALGISRSYISRIEKKALEKLRAAMEEE